MGLRSRLSAYWPGFVAIIVIIYTIWLLLAPTVPARSPIAASLVFTTRVVAALLTLTSARNIDALGKWQSWRYLGVSLLLWAVADGLEGMSWVLYGVPLSLPSVADLLRLAGYLSAIAAAAGYPASPPERFGRFRDMLDQMILGLAVLALTWLIFIRPVLDVGLGNHIHVFWTAIFPIFDMVLLIFLVRLALLESHPQERMNIRILWLAVFALTISDMGDGYRILQAEQIAGGLVEAGWMVSSALFALALRSPALSNKSQPDGAQTMARQRVASRLEPLLPIALTYVVVGFTIIDWWISSEVDWIGVAAAAILSLLLVARQGVIAGQYEMRRFAALVNAAADLAFICQDDGLICFSNPAFKKVLGPSDEADEDFLLADFLIAQEGLDSVIAQALKDGWTGEASFRRQDGNTFPVLLSLMPVSDAHQAQVMLAATAHDLTTIREREIALRKALDEVATARSELEALNIKLEDKVEARTSELAATVAELGTLLEELKVLDRMKTEFVALVSHELRAPLTNIRSGIELILNSDSGLVQPMHEALGLVQAETQRLTRFVETILDLSALEAGRFPLQLEALPIDDIARKVIDRFSETDSVGRLRLNLPHDLPVVLADEQALESVFFHLLDNALKYASEGEIIIDAWEEGSSVYVSVSDAGPGIPHDERERVFEMFHRADTSDAREVYGYGLGLAMVRRLLEAIEGGIRVEESPRGGARLVFWLSRG